MTPTPPTDTPAPNPARATLVAQAQADGDYGMTPTPAAVAAAMALSLDDRWYGNRQIAVASAAVLIERHTRVGALRLSLELVGRACGKLYMADADGGTVLVEDFVAAALSAAPAAGEVGK